MRIASRTPVLTLCMLLSATTSAEDPEHAAAAGESLTESMHSVETLLTSPEYAFGWALPDSYPVGSNGNGQLQAMGDFSFRDSSALARVSKLRYLSLFTFMETGKTRLFLGVNDDGLLGLHFNAVSDARDERYLELLRMPYLKDTQSAGATDEDN